MGVAGENAPVGLTYHIFEMGDGTLDSAHLQPPRCLSSATHLHIIVAY